MPPLTEWPDLVEAFLRDAKPMEPEDAAVYRLLTLTTAEGGILLDRLGFSTNFA
jgi:hypothetical protein